MQIIQLLHDRTNRNKRHWESETYTKHNPDLHDKQYDCLSLFYFHFSFSRGPTRSNFAYTCRTNFFDDGCSSRKFFKARDVSIENFQNIFHILKFILGSEAQRLVSKQTFLACMFCFPISDHMMFSTEFAFCMHVLCTWMHEHRTFERNKSLGYHHVV